MKSAPTSRTISHGSSFRFPFTAIAAPPQMHMRLNGAEPTTVPAPTVECWRKQPITDAKSSGALHPAARSVAPATSSGMPVRSQRMLSAGTMKSSHTCAIP